MDRILGIDVGTTAFKAGVIGTDGALQASFAEPVPTARPAPGWAEQDPADWTGRLDAALAALCAAGPVAAVGLTSQVNTHVFLDADFRPLMPAILWQDVRAAAEAAALDAGVSAAQKIAWWGAPMPIDASHALARMLWVSRHRPEVWARTRWVVLPKDYCLWHLTGRLLTDPVSNIGLAGPGGWIEGALALVPGAAARVAPLAGAVDVAARVLGGGFAEVPAVTATMDGWCALFGAGGGRDGAGVHVSGTSEVLGIVSGRVVPTPGAIVFPPLDGVRLHAGPTQAGGAALAWVAGLLGLTPDAAVAQAMAAPRKPLTPLFLPHLQGERAPLWDPALRGVFAGLDAGADAGDLIRAVLEGVALSARHVLCVLEASAGVRAGLMRCGGGGFRSDAWLRIKADVLGRPMARMAVNEPGLIGAAALAARGAGLFATLAAAQEALVRYEPAVEPDRAMRGFYDDLFGLYTQAIAANAPVNAGLLQLGR
ncbi:MAG: xylulokinase [Gemmobacter sp.]